MKKTILALATATVFATSANAATVFEQNGSKVEVNGTVGVLFTKAKEQRTDLLNDDSHFAFNVSHKINDNLTALGYTKLTFDGNGDSSFGNPQLNKLYAGLDIKGVGKLTFGKQATNGDDVQLNNNAYVAGGNNNLTTSADKVVKFRSVDMQGLSFGLDYIFGESTKVTEDEDLKYGYQTSVFYNNKFSNGLGFDFAAGYGVNRYTGENTTKIFAKENTWRTSAKVSYGPVTVGAEYGASSERFVGGNNIKSNYILAAVSYQVMEPSKVYVQWKRSVDKLHIKQFYPEYNEEILTKGKDTIQDFIVGVDYKFNKNVVTYLEYNQTKFKDIEVNIDSQNTRFVDSNITKNHTVGVGLRVLF